MSIRRCNTSGTSCTTECHESNSLTHPMRQMSDIICRRDHLSQVQLRTIGQYVKASHSHKYWHSGPATAASCGGAPHISQESVSAVCGDLGWHQASCTHSWTGLLPPAWQSSPDLIIRPRNAGLTDKRLNCGLDFCPRQGRTSRWQHNGLQQQTLLVGHQHPSTDNNGGITRMMIMWPAELLEVILDC